MKKLLFYIGIFCSISLNAQNWEVDWYGAIRGAGTSGQYMPFWGRTGEDGILPVSSSGLASVGADISYTHDKGWFFESGANLVGTYVGNNPLSSKGVNGLVDRLYLSGGWKMLHLDSGLRPRERELTDVSISGGNVMYSRNSRNMPGINAWADWVYLEKGHWVAIKGNLAHYQTIDNRYVSGTKIHNKSVAVKFALGRKVDFSFTFEHWAQWGGNSPLYGLQPSSFRDYVRIFMAESGGDGATESDQINVLGNHLGRESARLDWKHDDFILTFQYDKPFEDGTGKEYQNAPDGIWSVQYMSRNRKSLVTDVVLEYIKTNWQSGTVHDRPATEEEIANQDPSDPFYGRVIVGGCDNYFANGEYRSGWTYYNRIIGLPLILPSRPNENGVTMDVVSTRLRGGHLGMKGWLAGKVPYALKATYTVNYGAYNQEAGSVFAKNPSQLSLALEFGWVKPFKLPVDISLGIYGDVGELYQDSVGLTLKLGYRNTIN